MVYCNPETGVCHINPGNEDDLSENHQIDNTLLYFGDPMCSWCWGIAPEIDKLLDYISGKLDFKMIMGGLRPGGGDPWNNQMKNYLKTHWQHVTEKSGQPFSFKLFDRDSFNYDTEPPCRAVKAAQEINENIGLPFYHKIQHYFYAENKNPGEIEFYKPVCQFFEIDFNTFKELFKSDLIKERTRKDFGFTQRMGIQGFPSLMLISQQQPYYIARGYSTFNRMKSRISDALPNNNNN